MTEALKNIEEETEKLKKIKKSLLMKLLLKIFLNHFFKVVQIRTTRVRKELGLVFQYVNIMQTLWVLK